ncbi:LytTR family DNA-binding domain-containing protein [Persicobacter psychrovividus]|uniref:DNA-binding response regulator n=1 Tax=Persicobacter psychrovividus TaxID=387638 RepID=A0ABN6LC86_9BACT|nr:DNA-binding response regulator [Persicobacter psychrovividus]
MNIVIIEDEIPAQRLLKKYIKLIRPTWEISMELQSVEEAVEYFSEGHKPDLVFADIQLTDGLSFDAFEAITQPLTIVFTTAYDEYAVRAFKLNSLDYLLKPVEVADVRKAISRFEEQGKVLEHGRLQQFMHDYQQPQKYRQRLLIPVADGMEVLPIAEAALFRVQERVVYVQTFSGLEYRTDFTLDKLEGELDPGDFFRVNRQHIVHVGAIQKLEPYFAGKWVLIPVGNKIQPLTIPKEKVSKLRAWLDQ